MACDWWKLLAGSETTIRQVLEAYHVPAAGRARLRRPPGSYELGHGNPIYLIDQLGRVRKRTAPTMLVLIGRPADIAFAAGQTIPIAFYAWDGSNGEQNLVGSLSSWFSLVLEPRTPPSVFAYAFLTILGGFAVEGLLIRRTRLRPAVPRGRPVAAPAVLRGSYDAHHEEDA